MFTVHIIDNSSDFAIANICKLDVCESKTFLFSDLLEHMCIQVQNVKYVLNSI